MAPFISTMSLFITFMLYMTLYLIYIAAFQLKLNSLRSFRNPSMSVWGMSKKPHLKLGQTVIDPTSTSVTNQPSDTFGTVLPHTAGGGMMDSSLGTDSHMHPNHISATAQIARMRQSYENQMLLTILSGTAVSTANKVDKILHTTNAQSNAIHTGRTSAGGLLHDWNF